MASSKTTEGQFDGFVTTRSEGDLDRRSVDKVLAVEPDRNGDPIVTPWKRGTPAIRSSFWN